MPKIVLIGGKADGRRIEIHQETINRGMLEVPSVVGDHWEVDLYRPFNIRVDSWSVAAPITVTLWINSKITLEEALLKLQEGYRNA